MTSRPIRSGLRATALAAPLLFAACTVGPNYQRPALSPSAGYGDAGSSQLVSGSDIPAQWWTVFHSSDLDDLVALALKNNSTIEAADAALRAAHELTLAQRGADYPTVGVSVQPSRQDVARNLSSPLESNANLYTLNTTQVSIAYTPDLFGANRRAVESLVAQEDQQRFQLEAARLTLASNVVAAAVQDALLRAQIDETKAIILEQQQAVASFERQLRLGQVARADLAAQQTALAQAQASLPPLEKQFAINRDLLAALVGRTPSEPLEVRFDLQSLTLPEQLPLSLPAQLVEHRPDVRIAEAALHSASAQIGVAEAARWPNLEIGATAGGAALTALPGFGPNANFWSLAATLTQPVFDGGVLKHKQRAAEATYRQVAAQYQGTVIGAFQNTADVLHALSTDADAVRADETADDVLRVSLDVARRQLAAGDASALSVLSAEQAEHQTRLTLIQARAGRYSDVAALFQALGGGWWNNAAPAVTARSN
jgi:NodT family efflux transporter outer membrane factor (OMF) lipoprotein